MKKIILIICIILSFSVSSQAANIHFQWDQNIEPDLASYRLYQKQIGKEYDLTRPVKIIPAGNGSCILENVLDGHYCWVLTAVDTIGLESDLSNEVSAIIDSNRPDKPKDFQYTININININQ